MPTEAAAHLKTGLILWKADPNYLMKAFQSLDIEAAAQTIHMADLKAAEAIGVYYHEHDHIYRGQSTTIGLLLQLTEQYRVLLAHILIRFGSTPTDTEDLQEVLNLLVPDSFLSSDDSSESAQLKMVQQLLCGLTDLQAYLISGTCDDPAAVQSALSFLNFWQTGKSNPFIAADPLAFPALVEAWSRRGLAVHTVEIIQNICRTLPRGCRSLFEHIADSSCRTMTGYYPDRGYDILFGHSGSETNRLMRDGKLPNTEETAGQLSKQLRSLGHTNAIVVMFTEYKSIIVMAGEWCSRFVEQNKENAERGEYKFGFHIFLPVEFWAVYAYSVNPPLPLEGDGILGWVKDISQLDAASRFLRALIHLQNVPFYTPFSHSGESEEAIFKKILGSLYSRLDNTDFTYGSLSHLRSHVEQPFGSSVIQQIKFNWPENESSSGYFELLQLDVMNADTRIIVDFEGDLACDNDEFIIELFIDDWRASGYALKDGLPLLHKPKDRRMIKLYEHQVALLLFPEDEIKNAPSCIKWIN